MAAHEVDSLAGAELLARFLDEQITSFVKLEPILRDSPLARVARLHPVFASIIEDAISIRLLGSASRLNQAYVVSRALLERTTSFCFLQLCTRTSSSASVRRLLVSQSRKASRSFDRGARPSSRSNRTQRRNDRAAAGGASGDRKPTSERGREKTRWTSVSLPERAAVVEAKLGNTGLFMSLLTIYADASEALHGTLYGSLFHLGVYDFRAVPHDQESLIATDTQPCRACISWLVEQWILCFHYSPASANQARPPRPPNLGVRFKQVAVECGLA